MMNPTVYPPLKHVQRQRSRPQYLVMECPNIELPAKLSLRSSAEIQNLELADLIGQGLARHRYIAVYIYLDRQGVKGGVLPHIAEGLVSAPSLVMQAGIHDEPQRP